jgi:hypothetical protein
MQASAHEDAAALLLLDELGAFLIAIGTRGRNVIRSQHR